MTPATVPTSVLIVDDQPSIAQYTETMLIEIGVGDVEIAASVSDALQSIDGKTFDLAVLDYDLGMETGWLVAQRLCIDEIRMIVTTHENAVILPAVCGSAAVLKRPYDLNVLARLVAQS